MGSFSEKVLLLTVNVKKLRFGMTRECKNKMACCITAWIGGRKDKTIRLIARLGNKIIVSFKFIILIVIQLPQQLVRKSNLFVST